MHTAYETWYNSGVVEDQGVRRVHPGRDAFLVPAYWARTLISSSCFDRRMMLVHSGFFCLKYAEHAVVALKRACIEVCLPSLLICAHTLISGRTAKKDDCKLSNLAIVPRQASATFKQNFDPNASDSRRVS